MLTTLEALRERRLREPEKLASFVLGTCRMTVLDQRRSARRKQRLLEQFGAEFVTTVEPSLPHLDQKQLARCLQALKERDRSVIAMSFYAEQTGAEIAALLSITEAKVRMIRHRAIHR